MHIAFDTTAMPARRAGAGVYTYYLARALAAGLPDDARLTVFDRWGAFADLRDHTRISMAPVNAPSRARRLLWEQARLPWDLHRLNPDIFHGPHHALPLAHAGVRTVVTVHDVTFRVLRRRYTPTRRWYMHLSTLLSARLADRIIVPTHSVRDDFLRWYGGNAGRLAVIPEAPPPTMRVIEDPAHLRAVRERLRLPERFILSLGTLEPGKNRAALLRALVELRRRGLPHQLVVTGQQGWGVDSPVTLAQRHGVAGHVHFTGYVEDADLPALYNLADLFVFPSWREGFGLPPLEAMACGTPVVASDRPAMPEVLGAAALYAPPNRPDVLADAIEQALTDDTLAATLRRRGLAQAATYSWERAAQQTFAVYRGLMRG